MKIRECDFAGSWFPDSGSDCRKYLSNLANEYEQVRPPEKSARDTGEGIRAVVLPHAGWAFSGMTAWAALSLLREKPVELAIIFGGHLSASSQPTILECDAWRTPTGTLNIDVPVSSRIARLGEFEVETDRRHRRDNAVEVIVPMIAALWPETKLVVVGIPPRMDSVQMAGHIPECASEFSHSRILYVGSTDLTHYGPSYGFSPRGIGPDALKWVTDENDSAFLAALRHGNAIECLRVAEARRNACCPGAAAAAIVASAASCAHIVDYRTSHFRSGGTPIDFVGYGAAIFR